LKTISFINEIKHQVIIRGEKIYLPASEEVIGLAAIINIRIPPLYRPTLFKQ
jgi:hypothetical protein